MFNTIGWILIGICCFYLLRNIYAGILYQAGGIIKRKVETDFQRVYKGRKFGPPVVPLDFRNYYLFVLNPFWWRIVDVFADADWRQLFKDIMKDPSVATLKFRKN